MNTEQTSENIYEKTIYNNPINYIFEKVIK